MNEQRSRALISNMDQLSQRGASSPAGNVGAIGLDDFALLCWKRKFPLLAMTGCFAAAALGVAWVLPRWYEAQTVLEPVTTQTGGSGLGGALGSTLSQLGGVASLVGVSLGGASGGSQEAIATLQSEVLTEQYIRTHNLLPILYARLWDDTHKSWTTSDPDKLPTPWKGNRYFSTSIRNLEVSSKTGLVTLTISWKDPKLAAEWANGMVAMANDYLRQKAISEADRDIAYLNDEASKTSVVEVRTAINALMENEIKKSMLARGNLEYGLKVIDPAVAPERPTYPKKVLWGLGGGMLGLMIGLLVVLSERIRTTRGPE
jgi:uncharacterized protein involved in exopolysaccharide biosynthesis